MNFGRLLAPAQSVLATLLALSSDPSRVVLWAFVAPAAGVLVWAIVTMKSSRISIQPEVREDAELVTDGPYRWVRHPMYSALLLMTVGFLASDVATWRCVVATVLVGVLLVKSRVEETGLRHHFANYPSYQKRTGRFIPKLDLWRKRRTI